MTKEPHLLVGVFGLGAISLAAYYENVAPSLAECRDVIPGDDTTRQHLMDANLQVGSLALLVGALGWIGTKSVAPFVLSIGVISTVALWRYLILND